MADIVFQRDLLSNVKAGAARIRNPEDLATAFEYARNHPMWKEEAVLRKIPPKVKDEALALYNKVVADGRHVADFHRDPKALAKKFKLDLSDETVQVLTTVGSKLGASASAGGAIVVISISVVAVAVTTAIVSSAADPRSKIVIDQSGIMKL